MKFNSNKNYLDMERIFARISHLDHASAILGWDEAAMMPAGGGEARAQTLAELKILRHETLVSTQMEDLLGKADLEKESLSPWQRANLREARRTVQLSRSVSKDLVESISLASSRSEQAWRSLRSENNWEAFRPLLEKVVTLTREEAQQRAESQKLSPYDALLDLYSPGIHSKNISSLFDQVKLFLPSLIQEISERQKSQAPLIETPVISVEKQKNLGLAMMKILGFDFNHGRLDISHHPFCGGIPEDVRITTRYNTSHFIESLMGVIHETGHACYEQGLPREWQRQPVGRARGMQIHESQSLFFEIFVGRSRNFLKFLQPFLIQHLADDQDLTATNNKNCFWHIDNLFRAFNKVEPSYICVNADEVTYPAHIILRFEIERDLIAGQLEVKDIPEVWDQKMQTYLGLSTVGNFKDGCMQDVHWPSGAFGYFPSYSLGALTAAQLHAAMRRTFPDMDQQIVHGNLQSVHQWLRGHIWSQGSFSSYEELLIHATGETLNPEHFRQHLVSKFLE